MKRINERFPHLFSWGVLMVVIGTITALLSNMVFATSLGTVVGVIIIVLGLAIIAIAKDPSDTKRERRMAEFAYIVEDE
jgi:uncharacterized membrane protein HdeD (DUF308 family)